MNSPRHTAEGWTGYQIRLRRSCLDRFVGDLDSDELWRALGVTVHCLVTELCLSDADFGARVAAELIKVSSAPSDWPADV